MNNLYIKPTLSTPLIDFKTTGNLYIEGISTPENVSEFYKQAFDWIKNFKSTKKDINFSMFFNYLNTSSTRMLVDLILNLKQLKEEGINVNFIWKYEDDDDDMLEMGEELELVTDIKFEFKRVVAE